MATPLHTALRTRILFQVSLKIAEFSATSQSSPPQKPLESPHPFQVSLKIAGSSATWHLRSADVASNAVAEPIPAVAELVEVPVGRMVA